MSNQQSEKPDLPQHKPGSPWAKLIATYNFAASPLFPLHDLCSCSCAKVLILTQLPFAVEMWVKWAKKETQLGRTLVPCCQYNFISGILASGKTKMAPKPSKTTAARWLASNLTDVPVAMKCQINNQKSQIFLNTNLDRLGKTAGTYNFAASPFLHYIISTRVAVPKL